MSKVEFIWHCADEGESEFISGQIDLDPEFSQVVSDNFFELLDNKPTSPWIKVSDQEPPKDGSKFLARESFSPDEVWSAYWFEQIGDDPYFCCNGIYRAFDEWMLLPE